MMDLTLATQYAKDIHATLSPHCEIINLVGSVRRKKPQVKDIEFVCIPKKEFLKTDLFGGGKTIVSEDFGNAINLLSKQIVKGNVEGRQMAIITHNGTKLDLFMPQPHDYYRQLAIRTGSSEYSHFIIAKAWTKKGWVGTKDGLRLRNDCTLQNDVWICVNKKPTLPPVWKSEEEFFQWIDVKYLHPKYREVKKSVSI
jgi:DNA polymerase/3'-5' exonuclease PolX